MGKPKWTREEIIRHILDSGREGVPLDGRQAGGQPGPLPGGFPHLRFVAERPPGRRSFAGPGAIVTSGGRPRKSLLVIRNLSRRRRPLRKSELEERFGSTWFRPPVGSFGSWSKAILAAGVDPAKLRRVAPWTRERVLETLLTRALKNQPMSARQMEPRSIVEAGRRLFGSWSATLEAAGLDPAVATIRQRSTTHSETAPRLFGAPRVPSRNLSWTPEKIVAAILARLLQQKPLNAVAIQRAVVSARSSASCGQAQQPFRGRCDILRSRPGA